MNEQSTSLARVVPSFVTEVITEYRRPRKGGRGWVAFFLPSAGMVQHVEYQCAFEEWRPLLAACDAYASMTGWRFVLSDFMQLQGRDSDELRAARESAMPMALEFADRVRGCVGSYADGATKPRLVTEFEACQRLVSTEAVYNSMLATVTAVGLVESIGGAGGSGTEMHSRSLDEADDDAFAYHDMSQPIEIIARRLCAFEARLRASADLHAEKQRRTLQASFIVEFGLEHGLPEKNDATAERTLREFLERLGEWQGGQDNDTVRQLVLGSIPKGPGERALKTTVFDWFESHKGATLVGGAIVGGVIGVLIASTALAIAGSRGGRHGR